MNVSARTDVGSQRTTNEDTVLTESFDSGKLLVVADGMGGHEAGDVASEVASTELAEYIDDAIAEGQNDYETIIAEAIEKANQEIQQLAESDPNRSGMGTTVVVAYVDETNTIIGNVGDSRAYDVGSEINQITVDQSLVQEMVNKGKITPEEAQNHPQRNVISQAVGTSESVNPDFYRPTIDGQLLLCSDGLTEEVPDSKIKKIITEAAGIDAAAKELVERANQNGGSDNISVIVTENLN